MLGADEVGKTTRSFFDALKDQPLSLALVVMNFALVTYLFYNGSQVMSSRKETTDTIIKWQQDTDKLMASCVSQDVTKMMLDNVQQVTQTMLATAQKDIERMQVAIDKEREYNRSLLEKLLPPAPRQQNWLTIPKPIDYEECDPLGPYCAPL